MDFIKGADFSTLTEIDKCGGKYYDGEVQKDLVSILAGYGFNYSRIRLWTDPYSPEGIPYGAGTDDPDTAVKIAKRSKQAGMKILLDLQYSDFWADPGKQYKPKAWMKFNEDELEQEIYVYTLSVLKRMLAEDVLPDMVQIGNEITNGLLWPDGKKPQWDNITRFVNAGIRAVRDIDKKIYVMIHLDHGHDGAMHTDWFDNYLSHGGQDFDIIGLSYYPLWNGKIKGLTDNIGYLRARYGKEVVAAEVSQCFSTEDYSVYEGLSQKQRKGPAAKKDLVDALEYPASKNGQTEFMKAFMRGIKEAGGSGFFYWEPAWIPVRGSGWANDAALDYIKDAGPCGNEWADQALFDYSGHALPALKAIRDF